MRPLCKILLCCIACIYFVVGDKRDNAKTIAKNDLQMDALDQLLNVYVLNSTNLMCQRASEAYRDGLINFEPWALKMLDASSKFQSGIVAGNLIEYGSFQQCIDVETNENGGIRGKHCTVAVLPSEILLKKIISYRGISDKAYEKIKLLHFNASYKWSVCIPDACGPKDVIEHFRPRVNKLFEGLEIRFLDNEVHCTYKGDIDKSYDAKETVVIVIVALLVFIVTTSTFAEMYKSYYNIEAKGYAVIFSIASNTRYILEQNKAHKKTACLNGIRVFCIIWVILAHRFLLASYNTTVNSFEFLDWAYNMTSQIIMRGSVAVDTFILLSATLLAYNFLLSHKKLNSINLPMYYLHRYIRLTPSYAFWILIIVWLSHRFGQGPFWDAKWHYVQQPCKDYWWSALMYVQSYVNPKEVCILQSWYLTIDTFYYVCAPVLLLLIIKSQKLGLITIFVLYLASVGVSFEKAWKRRYRVQGLLNADLVNAPYFTEYYAMPQYRASSYIIGIVLGYMLFKTRDKKVQMSPLIVAVGWASCVTVALTVILSNRIFLDENYEYDRFGNALYLATHRSVWVLAVGWIIWACVHGYGGTVNRILSSDVFAILGKLSYSAYLVHMQFQFYDFIAMNTGLHYSNFVLVQKSISDVVIAFGVGYFLTVMVECPIYRMFLNMLRKKEKGE